MIQPGMDKLTKEELGESNALYDEYIDDWTLYDLVYRSGKPLIDHALEQHPRETPANYEARLRSGYVFNFARSIVNILNFYLHEKDAVRELEGLENDILFKKFLKDADLKNTNYNVLIDGAAKLASVSGSTGILVNKPPSKGSIAADSKANIYPYYVLYSLPNIIDWEWLKNIETHRQELVYLKLLESDGNYLLWWKDAWEIWSMDAKNQWAVRMDYGDNPLEEIPFVWMQNIKDVSYPEIGESDLLDIAHIVVSIIQNLSCGEEMINLAGFPMMREPMEKEGEQQGTSDTSPTGPRAVKEFDPTLGEGGKPDWMPTEILEPVEATLKWIDRKADEIYRVSHLSGVHGQRKSNNEVASGLALRYEFQQLNSIMVSKSTNESEAELQSLRFWLKWQSKEELMENIDIRRSKEFSIDEMSVALDNAIKAMGRVQSKVFWERVQAKIVKHILPDLSEKDRKLVMAELKKNIPEDIVIFDHSVKGVRSGLESRADHSDDE